MSWKPCCGRCTMATPTAPLLTYDDVAASYRKHVPCSRSAALSRNSDDTRAKKKHPAPQPWLREPAPLQMLLWTALWQPRRTRMSRWVLGIGATVARPRSPRQTTSSAPMRCVRAPPSEQAPHPATGPPGAGHFSNQGGREAHTRPTTHAPLFLEAAVVNGPSKHDGARLYCADNTTDARGRFFSAHHASTISRNTLVRCGPSCCTHGAVGSLGGGRGDSQERRHNGCTQPSPPGPEHMLRKMRAHLVQLKRLAPAAQQSQEIALQAV